MDPRLKGKYKTILSDPPWDKTDRGTDARPTGRKGGKTHIHYPTMPIDDICALPVGELAADDAHLWLWTMNGTLRSALKLIDAWGFTYMNSLTWCKKGHGNMGAYFAMSTEQLLFATRGKPIKPDRPHFGSWFLTDEADVFDGGGFIWPKSVHSRKPDASYDIVEEISPGPYVEIFARRVRFGWDAWGNEVSSDFELPPAT